ncbi:hypothetical protein AgCh_021775 [Apium graveolens]
MEILSSTTTNTCHIFPKLSFLCPKICFKTTHFKFTSKLSIHFPFSPTLPLSNSKRFKLSAHFGGPTSRRNSLRKKLTQHKQVCDNFPLLDSNDDNLEFNVDSYIVETEGGDESSGVKKESSQLYDDSVLSSKLRRWVDQYEADTEFWGIGSGRIFTVFRDSDGKIERVDVDEEEIMRRSGLEPTLYKASELEDLSEVNSKISHAKALAGEIENGNNVISEFSSVAKFVDSRRDLGFGSLIQGFTLPPGLLLKMSRVGVVALCGLCVFWAVKRLFKGDEDKSEYSMMEKEMLRRKMKARMEKDRLVKGNVEVIQASKKVEFPSTEKPLLDKQAVMDNITKAKASVNSLALQTSSIVGAVESTDFDIKIQEIKLMARHARVLEKKQQGGLDGSDEEDNPIVNELSSRNKVIQEEREKSFSSSNGQNHGYIGKSEDVHETIIATPLDDPKSNGSCIHVKTSVENSEAIKPSTSEIYVSNVSENRTKKDKDDDLNSFGTTEMNNVSDSNATHFSEPNKISVKAKPKVIRSVKEAREYLSKKRDRQEQSGEILSKTLPEDDSSSQHRRDGETNQQLDRNHNLHDVSLYTSPDLVHGKFVPPEHAKESNSLKGVDPKTTEDLYKEVDHQILRASSSTKNSTEEEPSTINILADGDLERQRSQELHKKDKLACTPNLEAKSDSTTFQTACEPHLIAEETISTGSNTAEDLVEKIKHQMPGSNDVEAPAATKGNWMENNFHEFEPVAKKIAVGFKVNYSVARQKKINQELNLDSEKRVPEYDESDGELDWMKDDCLREIVFQVRENELMGRDPFHLMDAEDKKAFFGGLEKKVEKVNEKLQNLHQWVHSNIENLDYGADGISIHDPPEKVIPRWKGPPVDTSPQSLDDYLKQRQALVNENIRGQFIEKEAESPLQTSLKSSPYENGVTKSIISNQNNNNQDGIVKPPKIIIEGSDGSVRAGKKTGKEYWEHTKKWSRGFLDSYNAETDPEIKATMKDIGKDLKRWITEKEIQESADLMDKLPERGQKFIQEKLSKVKREMDLYGPQAVINKYSEYTEEKEEDYLWWLDLPFVSCIELYTNQDGDQNIGFYSLEMAADLELDPKQYHMIGFEDTGDCKNMCYIIQSHLEMLGNGNAFVVAQQPKDAYREARANGFNVTVIRKGELKLNVDQNLEEVEEQIIEIGSKMYHDKMMKGRSMDISSLTKGVFGIKKPKKRRSKKKLTKPAKH